MIYKVQAHVNTRWRLVIDRDGCAARVLETNLTRKFAAFFQFGDLFQDLVVIVKNLDAFALVLGAISCPAISRVVIFMSFRFLELVVGHSAFAKVFERGNESLTGIWPRSL